MNCASCGKHIPRYDLGKWKKDGRPICRNCRKDELKDKLKRAGARSLSQIEIFRTKDNAELIDEIIKELKLKEQATIHKPSAPEKDEHGCIIGVERWNEDLHQCTKIETTPPTEPEKDKHGCIIGVEKWNDDLHQCVRIEKHPPTEALNVKEQVVVPHQPAPEIPAQPVVPVGPVTIEQKVAALNDAIAKIQKDIAFIFGVLGQRLPE